MTGTTLSHYRIEEELGRGGMGIVYKAYDTRLERHVAIKVLPPAALASQEDRSRFYREARAAAHLAHSNIGVVFEIDDGIRSDAPFDTEPSPFIVMEYIDGETLSEHVGRGPMKLDEVRRIGLQIASGLEAAHKAGVVHRDIKPSNVMLTSSGEAKILDFGLALTDMSTKLTRTGSTVGTVAYMSPEQARGEEVDRRTDIYSLGIVLYEMIAGQRPFRAEYEQALIYGILNTDPEPLTAVRTGVPMQLERLVDKCLAKDRSARYQSAADLGADLRNLGSSETTGQTGLLRNPRADPKDTRKNLWMWAGLLAAAGIVTAVWEISDGVSLGARAPVVQRQLTFDGEVTGSGISPDGRSIAYLSRGRLYVQDVEGTGQPLEIASGLSSTDNVEWSPEGTRVMLSGSVDGAMSTFIYPRLGGPPLRLRGRPSPRWSPTGSMIASSWPTDRRVGLVTVATGDTASLPIEGQYDWLSAGDWSPTGEHIAVRTEGSETTSIRVASKDGGEQTQVFRSSDNLSVPRWSANGEAIYFIAENDRLMRIRFVSGLEARTDVPELLIGGLQLFKSSSVVGFGTAGNRLVYVRGRSSANLAVVSLAGGAARFLTSGSGVKFAPLISPDEQWVAYLAESSSGVLNIFRVSINGGPGQQLTFLEKSPRDLAWSPNGSLVAFIASTGKIMTVPATGGTVQPVGDALASGEISWAPGERILYQAPGNRNFRFLDPATGDEEPLVSADSLGWMFFPHISPAGDHVAVSWNRLGGGMDLWIISLADDVHTRLIKQIPLGWNEAGDAIYSTPGTGGSRDLYLVPILNGEPLRVATLPQNCDGMQVSKVGEWVVCSMNESTSDVWMIDNFDPYLPPVSDGDAP